MFLFAKMVYKIINEWVLHSKRRGGCREKE